MKEYKKLKKKELIKLLKERDEMIEKMAEGRYVITTTPTPHKLFGWIIT